MEKYIEMQEATPKKSWKTPVLHAAGVEETLGGINPFETEDFSYVAPPGLQFNGSNAVS